MPSNKILDPPLLTIYCLVFNHEDFLHKCLDGFIMQQVDFPIEILIHDDASTDSSQNIIREYIEKYPSVQWNAILQTTNQYSQGISVPHIVLPHVRGKYMAFCEGDDYWTDPYKLQKQVDFLEANPDFSICHHPACLRTEDGLEPDSIWPPAPRNDEESVLELKDFVNETRLATCTVVYRWCFDRKDNKFEDQFPVNIFPGDYMLHLMHAKQGKIKNLADCMAVYRIHGGGAWSQAQNTDRFYTKNAVKLLRFYTEAQRITKEDFSQPRRKMLRECILSCLATAQFDVLAELQALYPEDYLLVVRPYSRAERLKDTWDRLVASTPALRFFKSKLFNRFSSKKQ